jgi:hypothetical protein
MKSNQETLPDILEMSSLCHELQIEFILYSLVERNGEELFLNIFVHRITKLDEKQIRA